MEMIMPTQGAMELLLRDYIANKERIVANMNRDLAEKGKWTFDWNKPFNEVDHNICELINK